MEYEECQETQAREEHYLPVTLDYPDDLVFPVKMDWPETRVCQVDQGSLVHQESLGMEEMGCPVDRVIGGILEREEKMALMEKGVLMECRVVLRTEPSELQE